jgi:hypothetical protein
LSFRAASSIQYTIELPNNKRGSRLKMQVIMKLSALYLLLLTLLVLLLCVSFKLLHVRYKYHKKGLQMFQRSSNIFCTLFT